MDGYVTIGTKLNTDDFDRQIDYLKDHLEALEEEYNTLANSKPFEGQQDQLRKLSSEIMTTKKKITSLKNEKDKMNRSGFDGMINSVNSLGNSMEKIIKKVSKWALAVFGVRSMYNLVKRSASTIAQYDKQIGTDIEYIRYALAFTLKPVVEWLVKAAYTILQYVGAIIYRLTGYNIFKNSGVKQFKNDMSKSEKSSKKIKENMLATFDEVTKLESDKDTGSGSSGGVGTPSTDLSKLKQIELPDWLKGIIDFIKEHKDTILKITGAVMAVLTFNKVIGWLSPIGSLLGLFTGGKLAGAMSGFVGSLAKALTIAGSIAMIGYSAYDLLEGNKQQRKQLNRMAEKGLEYSKDDAKNFANMNDMQDMLNYKRQKSNELLDKSNGIGAYITGTYKELKENAKGLVEQQDEYLQYQIQAYREGKLTKEQEEQLKLILMDQVGYCTDIGDRLDAQGIDSKEIRDYGAQYRDILGEMGVKLDNNATVFNGWKDDTKTMKDNMGQVATEIGNTIRNAAGNGINIKVKADTQSAKASLKELALGIARTITAPMRAVGLGATADAILNKVRNIKLAKGGIVNMPGRGVPINVIAGEAGSEAVIPLNDETMERLGSAIARHMSVNLTNINEMNGRTLSREIVKVMNESDFSYNG